MSASPFFFNRGYCWWSHTHGHVKCLLCVTWRKMFLILSFNRVMLLLIPQKLYMSTWMPLHQNTGPAMAAIVLPTPMLLWSLQLPKLSLKNFFLWEHIANISLISSLQVLKFLRMKKKIDLQFILQCYEIRVFYS